MGWLFFEKPHNVKAYLDSLLTWESESGGKRTVLDSALVARSEYYAAVQQIMPDGTRIVWAAIFLVKFRPRDPGGYTFGYKDMDETCGPYQFRCPERILDLLTPTDNEYAAAWRARCRERLATAKARPALRDGIVLQITGPALPTIWGQTISRVRVHKYGKRRPLFSLADKPNYGQFRWPSIRQYNYIIAD